MTATRHPRAGGAIAAGHPVSARAGADVLARGGNACDALVAAVLVSWVCEPTVSGACGGGFLLHRSATGRVDLLDFFAAAPGLGLTRAVRPMESFDVEFGTAVQRFHIGAGSVAVPGTAAGLGAAHRRFGSLPWAELVAPAAALARAGVVQTAAHARLNDILVAGRDAHARGARRLGARRPRADGGRDDAASRRSPTRSTGMAEAGADDLYRGQLADAVVTFSDEVGAALTARDLARLPGDPAAAGRGDVPRPPDPHERAAVVRRPAAGVRARAARPAAAAGGSARRRRRCCRWRRSCARSKARRGPRARADAGPQRRAAAAGGTLAGARPRPAARRPARRPAAGGRSGGSPRHEPRVGRGRRRQRRRDDELDRVRLRRVRRAGPVCTSTTCWARRI